MLQSIYDSFTEDFDTADLRDAGRYRIDLVDVTNRLMATCCATA